MQEANKTIAKLKGEILKLSSEVQNAQFQDGAADNELIEENEELKNQVTCYCSLLKQILYYK